MQGEGLASGVNETQTRRCHIPDAHLRRISAPLILNFGFLPSLRPSLSLLLLLLLLFPYPKEVYQLGNFQLHLIEETSQNGLKGRKIYFCTLQE